MTKVIISTTIRNSSPFEPSGNLYIFDILKQKAVHKIQIIEPPYRDSDPNPRGGLRGSKGIIVNKDEIFISNTISIFRFNKSWELLSVITHPSCASIHDIFLGNDETIWVTSTRNDIVFNFSKEGELLSFINLRTNKDLAKLLKWDLKNTLSSKSIREGKIDFRDPKSHNIINFDGTHVNSGLQTNNGDFIFSLGLITNNKYRKLMKVKDFLILLGIWKIILSLSQLIKIISKKKTILKKTLVVSPFPGKTSLLMLSEKGKFNIIHNFENVVIPGHSIINWNKGSIFFLNTSAGEIVQLSILNKNIKTATKVTNDFLRGGVQLNQSELVVGMSNKIGIFDVNKSKITATFNLSDNPFEIIFDIQIYPQDFPLPPQSFSKYIKEINLQIQNNSTQYPGLHYE